MKLNTNARKPNSQCQNPMKSAKKNGVKGLGIMPSLGKKTREINLTLN